MKATALLFLASLTPFLVFADGNNYGPSAYLRQGVGGRASGMGEAFVGLADDATAGYWNPAGLSQMGLYMYELGMQYSFIPNDMSYSYLAYAFQWPEVGNFSLSWNNFSVSNIEARDDAGNFLNSFGSSENTFILSYGRKVYQWVKGLSLGANLKILQQGIGDFKAVGHGLDVAAFWQPILYWDHTIGLNVQNIFQRMYWNSGGPIDQSLVNVKFGVAFRLIPSEETLYYNHLNLAFDIDYSEYSRFKPHLGLEYWFIQNLAARAGVSGNAITIGASYRPEHYEIDYAFYYDNSVLGYHQHRISLMLRFE